MLLATDNKEGNAHHRANVRGSLRENAGPLLEIRLLVARDGFSPGLVEVIEDNIGVREDEIGVEMVDQVVADGELDPVGLGREGLAVLGPSDNLELISRADTACTVG
jgi:hypothetical protein